MGKKIYLSGAVAFRTDTAESWAAANPILENGEVGLISDVDGENWCKVGDGASYWNDLPYKEWASVDQSYSKTSEKAQSGKAVAEGIDESVGDINAVLATVIEGSTVLPQNIINKVVEKAAAGVEKQIGNRFVTAVAVKDTGSIDIESNAAYFILSNTETGKINLFDRITDEPVEYTGKMIGLITGNYGDTDPAAVLGFVGIYSSAVITKGTYLALDEGKTGTLSWEGEATVITVKNVKGEN